MAPVLGFSTTPFPCQTKPLVVATNLGGIRNAAAAKPALTITAATLVVLLEPPKCGRRRRRARYWRRSA